MKEEHRKQFEIDSKKATNDLMEFLENECRVKESYSIAGAMCGLCNAMALLSLKTGISFETFKNSMLQIADFYESKWDQMKNALEEEEDK